MTPKYSLWFVGLFLFLMLAALSCPRTQALLPGLLGVGSLLTFYAYLKTWPALDKGLLLILGALLVLGAASSLWAPDGDYVLKRAAKASGVLLPGVALLAMAGMVTAATPYKDHMVRIAALVCAIAGVVFFFEYSYGYVLTRLTMGIGPDDIAPVSIRGQFIFNRSIVFLSLFFAPLLLALYACNLPAVQKRLFAIVALGGLFATLLMTQSQTAQVAVLLGGLMMLVPSHLKIVRRVMLSLVLIGIFAAPLIPIPAYKAFVKTDANQADSGIMVAASIPHRLEVWNFIAEKIAEKPLLGHGMDSTRFLYADEYMPNMKTKNVLHPHNAFLQIWIEFGLAGGLIAATLVAFLFYKLDALPPLLQRYYTAMLVVMMAILSIGYGLWQAWQLGFIFAIPAFSIMVTRLYPEKFGR